MSSSRLLRPLDRRPLAWHPGHGRSGHFPLAARPGGWAPCERVDAAAMPRAGPAAVARLLSSGLRSSLVPAHALRLSTTAHGFLWSHLAWLALLFNGVSTATVNGKAPCHVCPAE